MKLKVVNTGSVGNCYLLQSEHQTLILECGVPFKEIKKALDFDIKNVVGCFVTHEHKDHCVSINDVINSGIKVFSSKGTFDKLNIVSPDRNEVEKLKSYYVGEFKISVFDAVHDCREPINFVIEHEDMGRMLFVTDSNKIKYDFKKIDHYVVEANYSAGVVEQRRQDFGGSFTDMRIIESHLSIETLTSYLSDRDLSETKNIILIHLSDSNSDISTFNKLIEQFCFKTPQIASKGSMYELSKNELRF